MRDKPRLMLRKRKNTHRKDTHWNQSSQQETTLESPGPSWADLTSPARAPVVSPGPSWADLTSPTRAPVVCIWRYYQPYPMYWQEHARAGLPFKCDACNGCDQNHLPWYDRSVCMVPLSTWGGAILDAQPKNSMRNALDHSPQTHLPAGDDVSKAVQDKAR